MRYEDVVEYLHARIETKMAFLDGRRSLYGVDEVARLAEGAFAGEKAEVRQAVEDVIASAVSSVRKTGQRSAEEQMEDDRKNAGVLGAALMPMANYARQVADFIQTREAKRTEAQAATRAGPTTYQGVWREDGEYSRGNIVTDKGTLWHCEADRVATRPGDGPGWKLMHKNMERERRRA